MECVLSVVDEGTQLTALATRPSGEVVGQAVEPGPANVRFVGPASLRRKLEGLVRRALAGHDDPLCLSAAAVIHADPEQVREWLSELVALDGERIFCLPIERCALAGSLGTVELSHAVVIRADVGSRGWAVAEPGRDAWRGGFGEVLGDEGSAYWIGMQGIRTALKAYEKRHRNTALKTRLVTHFGVATYQELLVAEHRPPALDRYAIAGFAGQVFEAAGQGDDVAVQILDEAGRDLATIALGLVSDLDLAEAPFSVLPSGSVFRQRGACLEAFMKLLKNRTAKTSLVKEGMGPAAGAVLLAIQQLGLKVRPETVEVLRATLKGMET